MFSQAAASYYYQHRYAAYEDCINPCDSMTIVSISKYNVLNKYSTTQYGALQQVQCARQGEEHIGGVHLVPETCRDHQGDIRQVRSVAR